MPSGVYQRNTKPVTSSIEERCTPVTESGCWIWTGRVSSNGYGRVYLPGSPDAMAHRVSFEAFVGPIPEGMSVCHKCDTPPCVNPAHLFIGSQSDNSADMMRKMRSRAAYEKIKTHCKRGHELAGENLRVNQTTGRRQCRACAKITSSKQWRAK